MSSLCKYSQVQKALLTLLLQFSFPLTLYSQTTYSAQYCLSEHVQAGQCLPNKISPSYIAASKFTTKMKNSFSCSQFIFLSMLLAILSCIAIAYSFLCRFPCMLTPLWALLSSDEFSLFWDASFVDTSFVSGISRNYKTQHSWKTETGSVNDVRYHNESKWKRNFAQHHSNDCNEPLTQLPAWLELFASGLSHFSRMYWVMSSRSMTWALRLLYCIRWECTFQFQLSHFSKEYQFMSIRTISWGLHLLHSIRRQRRCFTRLSLSNVLTVFMCMLKEKYNSIENWFLLHWQYTCIFAPFCHFIKQC